jgi:predicted Holliday junction resolvase-like endonuclease
MNAFVFFQYNRQIFGICPCCGEFFRLSDCNLYQGDAPETDWLDTLTKASEHSAAELAELGNRKSLIREQANIVGRERANKEVREIDSVFHPNGLSADDAKTIFHPVDFIVFNGMNGRNTGGIEELVFLDGKKVTIEAQAIQNSIAHTVEKGEYEWIVLTVNDNGIVHEQSYWDADYVDDLRLPSFGPMPESDRLKFGTKSQRVNIRHDSQRGLP